MNKGEPHPNTLKTFFYSGSVKRNRRDYMYPSERIFSKTKRIPQHIRDISDELVKLKKQLNLSVENLLFYAMQLKCRFTSYTLQHWANDNIPGPGFPPTKHTLEGMIRLRDFLRRIIKGLENTERKKHKPKQ